MKTIAIATLGSAAVLLSTLPVVPALAQDKPPVKNIVLVHGAWADGSGWKGVYDILKKDGYHVSVVANPDSALADDVAATQRVLSRQDGPTILVGHSYGGAVITEAGVDPKVVGLVYIAAFGPDKGETVFGLLPDKGAGLPATPTADSFAFLNRDAFLGGFAPDVPEDQREFMADAQAPIALAAGTTPLKQAAWHDKPSWYLVSKDDKIIPPDLERTMAARMKATTQEVAGSHVQFVAHPQEAASLIEQAAKGVAMR